MGISRRHYYRFALILLGLASVAHAQFETKGIIFPQNGSYKGSSIWIKPDASGRIMLFDPSLPYPIYLGSLRNSSVTLAPGQVKTTNIDLGTGANQLSTSVIPEGSNHYYHTTSTLADVQAAGYITSGGADVRYLRSFTELDPIFLAHPAHLVTLTSMTQWNLGSHTLLAESDPLFTAHVAHQVNATSITAWNHGSHALFSESDPLFSVHPAHLVNLTSITQWNAGGSALKTESDPIFLAHTAHQVNATSITQWNKGGHALQAESDPIFTAHPAHSVSYTSITAWNAATHGPAFLTTGRLTAATLTLTTNSQTATLTPTDIMNLKNDVWGWIDGSSATSKKTKINVGRQIAGSEMFYVQGYAVTSNWVDVSPTLAGDDQSVMNSIPTIRSQYGWMVSDGGSNPNQNIDLGHGTLPSGHDGIRINTKLPAASAINRMSIYKTGWGGTLAFDNMMIYGSNDSTNGTDGNWTTIAGPFTPTTGQRALANVWVNWDFLSNSASYKWIRMEGDYNAAYAAGLDYWTELRYYSYQTPAANATWVDGQGNPGTSGKLTAATLTLTTNSQTATISPSDVAQWKTYTGSSDNYLPLSGGTITGQVQLFNPGDGSFDYPSLYMTGRMPAMRLDDTTTGVDYAVQNTLNELRISSKVGAAAWQKIIQTDANGNLGVLNNVDALSMSAPTIHVNGNQLRIKSPTTAEAYMSVTDANPESNLHIFPAGYYPGKLKLTLSNITGNPSYSELPFMEISSATLNLGGTSRLTIGKMTGAVGTATVSVPAIEAGAIKVAGGAGTGKVWTSDAVGNGSWQGSALGSRGTASFVFTQTNFDLSPENGTVDLRLAYDVATDSDRGVPLPFGGHIMAMAANLYINSIAQFEEAQPSVGIEIRSDGANSNSETVGTNINSGTSNGRYTLASNLSGGSHFSAGDFLRVRVANSGEPMTTVQFSTFIVTVTVTYD